MVDIVREDSQN